MHEFEASGLSAHDVPPILQVAHSVIPSVVGDLTEHHSDDEIRISAEIVEQFTAIVCENIFVVLPPGLSLRGSGSAGSRRRGRQRSGRRRH
jgi:hypothetical protein